MRQTGWTSIITMCILVAAVRPAESQSSVPSSRTTMSGVYTAQQAARGSDVYAGMCKSCHAPESHSGAVFKGSWEGKLLSELMQYVTENMPKNEPGSLAAEEYAQVTAYLLKLNGMPAGDEELPVDPAALAKIRIATKKSPHEKASDRKAP